MTSSPVISVENLSKTYRLGQISTGMLAEDLKVWWAKVRGKPNPLLKVGEMDHGNRSGETLWALNDVSFTVEQGEVLGIIGRNGAGKSTLLKILSQVTAPTSGEVKVNGRIASLLEVGTGFHPDLTGRENIYLNGAILGMSKEEVRRKFDEIVAFSEVEAFIDTPVKRYSSGMYVRLAFAVAAHLEPEILLVDEVLAVGDAEFQKKCLGKMGDVAKHGRTIFFVSHNMTAVNGLCKRAILLSKGQILEDGETSAVISKYLLTGNMEAAEKVWDDPETAPGNHNARLHAVRVTSQGLPVSQVDSDQEIDIEIEFWNLNPGSKLVSEIRLLDSNSNFVLETFNTPEASGGTDPLSLAALPAGLYRSICRFPPNFFNDRRFFLTAIVASLNPAKAEIYMPEVVSFSVFDSGAMRTPGLSGTWFGAIRTPLEWQTTRIQDIQATYLENRI